MRKRESEREREREQVREKEREGGREGGQHIKMFKCFNERMLTLTQPESLLHCYRLQGFKLWTGLPRPLILAPLKTYGQLPNIPTTVANLTAAFQRK